MSQIAAYEVKKASTSEASARGDLKYKRGGHPKKYALSCSARRLARLQRNRSVPISSRRQVLKRAHSKYPGDIFEQ
jgi:hypothetical protein